MNSYHQFCKAGFAFTVLQSRVSFHSFANQGFLSQFWKAGFTLTVLKSRVSFHSFAEQGFLSQCCKAGFPFAVLKISLHSKVSFYSFAKQGFLSQFCKGMQSSHQFTFAGFPPTLLHGGSKSQTICLCRVSSSLISTVSGLPSPQRESGMTGPQVPPSCHTGLQCHVLYTVYLVRFCWSFAVSSQ